MREWRPFPRQERFLASRAFEVLFGGAAGGAKSAALLVGALRYVHVPSYRAILFRRSFPELERTLIDESKKLFRGLGSYHAQKHVWTFPSGAQIEFGYLERDEDVHRYQGAQYQYVAFDELTTNPSPYPYTYMISRLRSVDGVPLFLRAASNPGGPGHDWVMRRFAPWLYEPGWYEDEFAGPYAEPGEVLHFVRVGEEEHVAYPDDVLECTDCGAEWRAGERTPPRVEGVCTSDHLVARSRQFIPSRLEDNPALLADGQYAANLQSLDPLTYQQLREGNWLVRPAAGMFFKREWFRIEQTAPARTEMLSLVRYWDRAGTEELKGKRKRKGPDWTVGVLMGRHRKTKLVWVLDVIRERLEPHDVQQLIIGTAHRDKANWGHVRVALEQDPGQAGKFEVKVGYASEMPGFEVVAVPAVKDKITRAKPWSAHCKLGTMRLVSAPWNNAFINEHVAFPEDAFDDQVDAASGAWMQVARTAPTGSRTRGKRALGVRRTGGF